MAPAADESSVLLDEGVSVDGANGTQKGSRQSKAHTRTYQACIPCRRRKVRRSIVEEMSERLDNANNLVIGSL